MYTMIIYNEVGQGGWRWGEVMTLNYNHTQHPLDNQSVIECYTIVIPIMYIMFLYVIPPTKFNI